MEQYLRDRLKDLMYKYAVNAYNNHYSSASYLEYMNSYKEMISVLISLAKESNIDILDLKVDYCGSVYSTDDFSDYEELTEYW